MLITVRSTSPYVPRPTFNTHSSFESIKRDLRSSDDLFLLTAFAAPAKGPVPIPAEVFDVLVGEGLANALLGEEAAGVEGMPVGSPVG